MIAATELQLTPPIAQEEQPIQFKYLETMFLGLEEIVLLDQLQSRERTSVDHINRLIEHLNDDGEVDPIKVFVDSKGTYHLVDGFHRYQAFKSLDKDEIEAHIYSGDLRDAVLYSVGANGENKIVLARTRGDKTKAVKRLLDDPQWSMWSTKQIAEVCRVSPSLVSTLRNKDTKRTEEELPTNTVIQPDIFSQKPAVSNRYQTTPIEEEDYDSEEFYQKSRADDLNDIFRSFKANLQFFSEENLLELRKELDKVSKDPKVTELEEKLTRSESKEAHLRNQISTLLANIKELRDSRGK